LDLFLIESLYVAQAGLDLLILLPWPPEYWNYRCVSPSSALLAFSLAPLLFYAQPPEVPQTLGPFLLIDFCSGMLGY
jgi:hypothetical protein